uniref:Putative salivary kunitz domain protein n=1 Tax=Ixodes ricinus TaxID=34613 RepID=A0A0K8R5A1_IXORI
MKAFIGALCFLLALSYVIATLSEEECRRPLAFSSCAEASWTIYSFFGNTNQCERYTGCDTGVNRLGTLEECSAGVSDWTNTSLPGQEYRAPH